MKDIKMKVTALILMCICSLAAVWGRGRKEDYPDPRDSTMIRIADTIPVDPRVTAGKLQNGLTYFIRHNGRPENQLVLRLVVNAGSILEKEEQRGLEHFTEHMAFNGTKNFEKHEIIDYLEGIGMRFGPEINAYTSFDETVYKLIVPTEDKQTLEKAFQILSEWAFRISFDESEIEKERGVVIEEWRLGRGAQARMRDTYFPLLLAGSKYAERLPIGKKEIIESFDYQTLRSFYEDWYRPDLMAVVAVGDYPEQEIESLIAKYFGNKTVREDRKKRPVYKVPDHKKPLYTVVTDPETSNTVVRMMIKHDPLDTATVETYRESIIRTMYNRMLNQRFDELTQQSDPPFIYAFSGNEDLVRTKTAYVLAAVVAEGEAEGGLEALLTEAKRVRKHGFTEGEFQRVRAELEASFRRAYEEREKTESSSLAAEYVRHFLTGEIMPGISYEYELFKRYAPGIQLAEVNALAESLITTENRVILITGPEKRQDKLPDEERLAAVYENVQKKNVSPYVDAVSEEPLFRSTPTPGVLVAEKDYEAYGITEWTFDNGVRVHFKPTDFKNKEVLLAALSPGGVSIVSDEDYVSAMMLPSILGVSGIGPFSAVELQKKLAGKQVSLTPTVGDIFEGFSGSTTPEDAETLFQLVHLYMTAPRRDETAFASLKSRYKALVANRLSQPEAVYADRMQEIIFQGHFRRRPLSSAVLDEMNLDSALRVYSQLFGDAGDFTFFIAGNINRDRLKALAATYLGSLPASNTGQQWQDEGVRFPDNVIEEKVYAGVEAKSKVTLVFGGPLSWSYERQHLFDSLRQVLDIRLREVIREGASGTYDVGVAGGFAPYPRENYLFQIYFGCEPSRAEELTDLLIEELKRIRNTPVDEGIITKVREQQRTEYEKALRKNTYWINAMQEAVLYDISYEQILTSEDLIALVTPENIRDIAAEIINFDRYVLGTLYPKGMEPQ